MNIKQKKQKIFLASICFVMGALGSKVSLAYWASSVTGSATAPNGTVNAGTWDRYATGTAISSCTVLRNSVLNVNTSGTFYLTQNLNCSTASSPNSTTSVFSGTLYGNGFTISNYTISSSRRGLFYYLSGAKIQNLILDNIKVGTTSSRSTGATGVLASTNNGANTTISKVRIYNSSVYTTTLGSGGGMIGRVTAGITIDNVMLQTVVVDSTGTNTGTGTGGIVGRMSAAVTMTDVYFEGSVTTGYNSGGIVGLNESTGILNVTRAITYANASIRATSGYAAGVLGKNNHSGGQTLTDVFFTGPLYSPSNYAGTLYYGTAMTYTNAWAAQWSWSGTPTIAYTAMAGTSANYTTNYVALRSSLTTTWWTSSLPNIATNGRWTYDATTYLFELKPKV